MGATAENLSHLFSQLWSDYTSFNPEAKRIHDLILTREQGFDPSMRSLLNDHVALRTFKLPGLGVDALGELVKPYGYRPAGEYVFADKKLFARHFEHAQEANPKIFISELEIEKLSPVVQEMARAAGRATPQPTSADFFWSGRPWKADHATYLKLLDESEYAAWMYAFGFRCNHFTVDFSGLKTFADLSELNEFIRAAGFKLNTSGGEIKGSREVCLEQSSTLASKVEVRFDDGVYQIPSTYYEFARRYRMKDGHVYQGFVAASADKIFESTNVK